MLIGYSLILLLFGGSDPFGLSSNIARTIDIAILGENHLWKGTGIPFDPEGLLSTFPAIVTVLIGFSIGQLIQKVPDQMHLVRTILIRGAGIAAVGWLWGFIFPINKQLWTSTYVLYTGGLASFFLAAFIWLIDIRGYKKLSWPFMIFGTNSIFVFIGSGLWVKTILKVKFDYNGDIISGYSYLYNTVFQPLAGNINGSFLFALAHVLGWWLILFWLYRKKIFIKI